MTGADGGVDPHRAALTSLEIVGQLAVPARLRILAALVLGADTPSRISALSGLEETDIGPPLTRLQRSGLVYAVDGRLAVRASVFSDAARAEAPKRPSEDLGAVEPAVTRVLRVYLVDGRLTQIPAAGRKRSVVLNHLAMAFEPGVRYPEAQVNAILRAWHEDVAALRRYLVEEQLLSRAGGEYWRIGGAVDVQ